MVVLIVEKVSASLRGELSRWMVEPRPGVFVGQISAMVRDRLWEMAVEGTGRRATAKSGVGGAMLLWSSPTEQGFQVRVFGDTTRDLRDWEGLSLVHVPTTVAASKPGTRRRTMTSEAKSSSIGIIAPCDPAHSDPAHSNLRHSDSLPHLANREGASTLAVEPE